METSFAGLTLEQHIYRLHQERHQSPRHSSENLEGLESPQGRKTATRQVPMMSKDQRRARKDLGPARSRHRDALKARRRLGVLLIGGTSSRSQNRRFGLPDYSIN